MEKIEMISTTATKKDTQEMIKALRKAGLKVDKILSGYECKINGKTIFKAMTGHRIYGIRYAKGLFN
jgi:methylmalonyl-CoA mutase cobalamin-binding subunit